MMQPDFEIGRAILLRKGREVALFAAGGMVHVAEEARLFLSARQIDATIVDMHTIKPLDTACVLDIASTHKAVFSIEEHSIVGGLGSAIGEVLLEHGYAGIFKRFGIPDRMPQYIGTGGYLKERMGLTGRAIADEILNCTGQRKYGIAG
jgi:transketolase